MTMWVVVADSSRGKIYCQDLVDSDLREMEDLVHPDSRLYDRDLVADQAGSDGGSMGQGRHVIDARTDARHHEVQAFANEITQHLEAGRAGGTFDRLVLMAPPEFLGVLRDSMGSELSKKVVGELNKNLVRESAREVQEYLKQLM